MDKMEVNELAKSFLWHPNGKLAGDTVWPIAMVLPTRHNDCDYYNELKSKFLVNDHEELI